MSIPEFAARPQLAEDVARIVRRRIFDGTYAAGTYVRLDQLAAGLGVSVTPVREALFELKAEGLLEQQPRRGFVVRPVTVRDITDVSNVQAYLGGELAARAAEGIGDAQLAELTRIQTDLEAAYAADDGERAVRLNHEFHRAINVAADSPTLAQLMPHITRVGVPHDPRLARHVQRLPPARARRAHPSRPGPRARGDVRTSGRRRSSVDRPPDPPRCDRRGLRPRRDCSYAGAYSNFPCWNAISAGRGGPVTYCKHYSYLGKRWVMGVLDGIRVLDYGRFIAAPWCSALLADMGADVVRIEKREGGEDRWVQSVTAGGEGGTFLQCNRNKRSLTLDTTTDDGKAITRKLVARADIVVANMPAAGMRASGLDYETLRGIKQDIILASATAYGEGGPYSDRIGFDGAGQVMSGAVYRQGLPDQPIRTVVPYADFGTALTMTIGVMMALYHRDRTGEGQHVEGALLPTAMMLSNAFLIERDLLGTDKPRMGNQGTSVAPCDLYRTSDDGWVLLQIAGPPMFKRWCRLVGRPELVDDPRFADDDLRWKNGDVLNDIMARWCADKTKADVLERLEAVKLPAAPLHSTQDVLDDPHVAAMGYLQRVPFPGAVHDVPIIQTPFRLSATPGVIRRRAPLRGERTVEILDELGYTGEDIAALRDRDVV